MTVMVKVVTAGIDEAGRGALAGPVVAAAVILPSSPPEKGELEGVCDSKQLSAQKRAILYAEIMRVCDVGVGVVSAEEIDQIGIKKATNKAMQMAVLKLQSRPEKLMVDGRDRFVFDIESEDVVKGDEKIPSISAASIIAKVTRDEMMDQYDQQYPEFEFRNNKGYGSEKHLKLINDEVYTPIHRKSYDPLKTILTQGRLF